MAEYINFECESTNDGRTEKMIMVTISLQEYRSLIEENVMQRLAVEALKARIETIELKKQKKRRTENEKI